MINPSSSSSSGDAGAGAGGAGAGSSSSGIQFRMTVKLDIEGRMPSSSDAQSVCAAAASSSTQDLLLKLQPLLPHLSITRVMESNNQEDDRSNPEAHLQAEQETREEDVTNCTTGGAAAGATGGDDSGLELSLGFSSFKERFPGKAPENSGAQPAPGAQIHQDLGGAGALPRQASNAAAAAGEWRLSEEQRMKREAQFQKRQEARKKRRILIDEQKRLKSYASGSGVSRRSSCRSPPEAAGNDTGVENPRRIRSSRLRRRGSVKSEPAASAADESCSSPLIDGAAAGSEWASKLAEMQRAGSEIQQRGEDERKLTRQMSLSFGMGSPPPPPLPPPLPPVESVSSSLTCVPSTVASSFAVPAPVSPNKVQPQTQDCSGVKTHPQQQQQAQAKSPQGTSSALHDCSNTRSEARGGVLLRSASVGAGFLSFHELQQQQMHKPKQNHSIEMPSPVRCSSSSTNSSLLRTLSEGAAMRSLLTTSGGTPGAGDEQRHFCWRKTPHKELGSAFRSPKKEPADGSSLSSKNNVASTSGGGASPAQLPWVSATGTRTVSGVLLAYKKGDVRIVCACHGHHMSAREFVQHAGAGDVPNPEKCIVVSPSRRLSFS